MRSCWALTLLSLLTVLSNVEVKLGVYCAQEAYSAANMGGAEPPLTTALLVAKASAAVTASTAVAVALLPQGQVVGTSAM
ncbi:hypothetical protein ACSBR1_019934 [Camellia fascicularis]